MGLYLISFTPDLGTLSPLKLVCSLRLPQNLSSFSYMSSGIRLISFFATAYMWLLLISVALTIRFEI
jgi:hypothetical protein